MEGGMQRSTTGSKLIATAVVVHVLHVALGLESDRPCETSAPIAWFLANRAHIPCALLRAPDLTARSSPISK